MARLRDLPLVDASVRETATLAEAVARLFEAKVPAIAVIDQEERVVGIISEVDVLRAAFPGYLAEIRHTAFLADEPASLAERTSAVRSLPAAVFARTVETLGADETETHAAERLLHTREQALPVVAQRRFVGMLSIAALCHARMARGEPGGQSAQS